MMKPFDPVPKANSDQQAHWDSVFAGSEHFFGEEASEFAKQMIELFIQSDVESVLELGSGQGRDALLFAQRGFAVSALDYSDAATQSLQEKADQGGLSKNLVAKQFDVRERLPFEDASFDACYSHMLLCMHLSTTEVAAALREMHRVLKPGGLAVYSVRSSFDPHYQAGEHLSENIFNVGGFVVHFFTEAKIEQLAKGFELQSITRMEEGSLPRDLFCVVMKKGDEPESWELDPLTEEVIAPEQALRPVGRT